MAHCNQKEILIVNGYCNTLPHQINNKQKHYENQFHANLILIPKTAYLIKNIPQILCTDVCQKIEAVRSIHQHSLCRRLKVFYLQFEDKL